MRQLLFIAAPLLFAAAANQAVSGQAFNPGGSRLHVLIDPQPLCEQRYVDPVNGSNSNPGTINQPWKTLSHAMININAPGTIILLPGIYAPSTNQESYPIWMRKDVSIQGTSAMNTILKGEGSSILLFMANPSDHDTYENVLVDAVTLTDGYAGVEMLDECAASNPTIANCFIVGNVYGVHMNAVYDYGNLCPRDDHDGNDYIEHRPKFINDTIADNEIGILDDSNTLGLDPDGTVNGEADPAIINCIIYPNFSSDIEGVDGLDMHHTAFCTWDQAGISKIRAGKPAPVSYVNICGIVPSKLYINSFSNDYRLLPGQTSMIVRDNGTTTNLCTPNGTCAHRRFRCGPDIFDVDCEGYCNPRIEGGKIDLGADEEASQVIAGYMPFTTTFGIDPVTGTQYYLYQLYMDPKPAMAGPLNATLAAGWIIGTPAYQYLKFYPLSVPGARMNGTVPPTPTPPYGDLCFDLNTLVPGMPLTIGMPPVGTPWTTVLTPNSQPILYNQQLIPSSGGVFGKLSNLQSYFLTQ
ncbi:MAG TPA: DUF1565 domain-containing protein [Phycisphaeraceae bacterium]|nr:DUF1565 domain-containing protein [Phycisphaeraceae bacterium]